MSKIYEILGKFVQSVNDNALAHHLNQISSEAAATREITSQKQAEQEIIALLPVEMANTKIAPAFDTYYHGYNSCVKEIRESFGINEEKGEKQ